MWLQKKNFTAKYNKKEPDVLRGETSKTGENSWTSCKKVPREKDADEEEKTRQNKKNLKKKKKKKNNKQQSQTPTNEPNPPPNKNQTEVMSETPENARGGGKRLHCPRKEREAGRSLSPFLGERKMEILHEWKAHPKGGEGQVKPANDIWRRGV